MPTVEELYRNYGILADATEQVGQVGPRGLEGPPLGAGLPPHWAATPGAHSGRERCLGLLGSARSRSPAFPGSLGTRVQPRRLSHFPDWDETESFPQDIRIVGSWGRSCEWSTKSRIQGLCKARARPCRLDWDRNWRRRSFPARLGICRAPSGGGRWRRGGSFVLAPPATSDFARKVQAICVVSRLKNFMKKVAGNGLWRRGGGGDVALNRMF